VRRRAAKARSQRPLRVRGPGADGARRRCHGRRPRRARGAAAFAGPAPRRGVCCPRSPAKGGVPL